MLKVRKAVRRILIAMLVAGLMALVAEIAACMKIITWTTVKGGVGCSANLSIQGICDEQNRPQTCGPCPRALCRCTPELGWHCPPETNPTFDLVVPPDLFVPPDLAGSD